MALFTHALALGPHVFAKVCPVALFAIAPTFVQPRIEIVVNVTAWAMCALALVMESTVQVLLARNWLKMLWAYTCRSPAKVVKLAPFWDGSDGKHVSKSVCQYGLVVAPPAAGPKSPVAFSVFGAHPKPAFICECHFGPKAFWGGRKGQLWHALSIAGSHHRSVQL